MCKVYDVKKYRGGLFHDTEEWCKIWRKTLTCGLENDRKTVNFHQSTWKLGLSKGPFIQSRKCMSLKFTEELCVMTMRNCIKFGDKLTVVSKLTGGIWQILTGALGSQKKYYYNGLFVTKVYNVWAKKSTEDYIW